MYGIFTYIFAIKNTLNVGIYDLPVPWIIWHVKSELITPVIFEHFKGKSAGKYFKEILLRPLSLPPISEGTVVL